MTPAQRRALAAIKDGAIVFYSASERYYTLGTKHKRARQNIVAQVVAAGLAESVFADGARVGFLVLTDAGRTYVQTP